MIVSVKTTGLLGKFLPPGSSRNRGDVELPHGSSVSQLVEQLGIPDDGRCNVIINDNLIHGTDWADTTLTAADKIVLMAPITAG